MRIAIIGTGIAGNTVAWKLHRAHEITVFEAAEWIGGHTHTIDVDWRGRRYAVDTGFIVCNDWTYPNFLQLLEEIGVETQPSTMSFSVRCERTGLEYNGTSLNTLFAQRRNLLRPAFHRMLRDIMRFNREAPKLLDALADLRTTLGDFLARARYGREFIEHYLTPMGAAIWSTDPARLLEYPAVFFIRFFSNHGMLSIDDRPQWRVVRGGSRTYVEKLTAPFRDRIRIRAPVSSVGRVPGGVEIEAKDGTRQRFDAVFIACHSDEALQLLHDPSAAEREVLSAIAYQANDVVLHTDTSLLPTRRRAWAAWNYHVLERDRGPVAVTYNMNTLQSLDAPDTFCVTLNRPEAIDPAKVIARFTYHHPLYTSAAVAAQARRQELNGASGIYYCGAYWGHGFHEDGVVSALNAVRDFEERCADAQRSLRRLG
ncbi:MAG: FAD-dependent oxidoreductase [Lysobacterales bacterium]|nr:MAG: FAD-dependent oxidoreductase [Xanthomonadales bacterium]